MKGKITVEKRSFRKMAEVEFVGEVPSRKRKGGSHTDKNKKKKREPTIEILESPIAPVEVQSPAESFVVVWAYPGKGNLGCLQKHFLWSIIPFPQIQG